MFPNLSKSSLVAVVSTSLEAMFKTTRSARSMRSMSHGIGAGVLALFALGLMGCGGNTTLFSPSPNTVANVRVFNGLIGSNSNGGVNVRLRTATTAPVNPSPVAYGAVSANTQGVSGNGVNTYLFLANGGTYLSSQSLDYPPDNTTNNTTGELLVATGIVGQSASPLQPQIIYVPTSVPLAQIRTNDNPTANAALRVVNAAPASNTISIYNEAGPVPFNALSGISFGNYSSGTGTTSNYATITAGLYNLSVRDTASGNVLVQLPNINLVAGNAYTLIVFGSPVPAFNATVGAAVAQDYPLQ